MDHHLLLRLGSYRAWCSLFCGGWPGIQRRCPCCHGDDALSLLVSDLHRRQTCRNYQGHRGHETGLKGVNSSTWCCGARRHSACLPVRGFDLRCGSSQSTRTVHCQKSCCRTPPLYVGFCFPEPPSARVNSLMSLRCSILLTSDMTRSAPGLPTTGTAKFRNFRSSDACESGRWASPSATSTVSRSDCFANATRAENIATARALLNVTPPAADPQEQPDSATDAPRVLPCSCPCCGARMIVIEVFARGCQPSWRPTPDSIDTS